jgi:hypothetical protein
METRRTAFELKQILAFSQLRQGMPKVNAWGENHLWLKYRKGFKLSGLVEPRIAAHAWTASVKHRSFPTFVGINQQLRVSSIVTQSYFDSPDIVNELNKFNCRMIPRFDRGYEFIQSQLSS